MESNQGRDLTPLDSEMAATQSVTESTIEEYFSCMEGSLALLESIW